MNTELAQKFVDFKLPDDYRVRNHFIKMMLFANENQINNDDIDYYMACPPRRIEGESYDDMKVRTQFANKLLKYRAYLYDYSVYENN
jgi:hypothetical protein